jgi:predicted DNA-binding transcriptional regulator YafY
VAEVRRGPDGRIERLVRLLAIARLVSTSLRWWTRARLAEHFGVAERTIDKDLALLRAAGFFLRRHRGGYAVDEGPRWERNKDR